MTFTFCPKKDRGAETQRSCSGFTLLELMVTLAIMAILMTWAGLAFLKRLPDYHLAAAAQELYLDFHQAKSLAVLNTETVQIKFDTTNGSYQIQTLGSDGAEGGTGPAADRLIKQVRLGDFKSGIRFGRGAAKINIPGNPFNDNYVTYTSRKALFSANGMVNTKGYVYLSNKTNTLCYGLGTPTLSGVLVKKKTAGGNWVDG